MVLRRRYRRAAAPRHQHVPRGSRRSSWCCCTRFNAGSAPLTLLPCEPISRNGERRCVRSSPISRVAGMPSPEFISYIEETCVWVNSLVDLHRVGADPAGRRLCRGVRTVGDRAPGRHGAAVRERSDDRHRRSAALRASEAVAAQSRPHGSRNAGKSTRAIRRENTLHAMRDPALRADLESLLA